MICTDTDHYVNTWSTIKKEKKKKHLKVIIWRGLSKCQVIVSDIQNIPEDNFTEHIFMAAYDIRGVVSLKSSPKWIELFD